MSRELDATDVEAPRQQNSTNPNVRPAAGKIDSEVVKHCLVSRTVNIVAGLSIVSLLVLVGSWSAAVEMEGGSLKRRHIASIIGFGLVAITTLLFVIVGRMEPNLLVLWGLEVLAGMSLFMSAVSMGMNNVIVDICWAKEPSSSTMHCTSHTIEFVALLGCCVGMATTIGSAQQRIVLLVDRGILKGIGERMSRNP